MWTFCNPNIHPYLEYKRRLDALIDYSDTVKMRLIRSDDYPMEEFLRNVVSREKERCRYCYYSRLKHSAHIARRGRFDGFTTTLLYSKFQDHEMIKNIGENWQRNMKSDFTIRMFVSFFFRYI